MVRALLSTVYCILGGIVGIVVVAIKDSFAEEAVIVQWRAESRKNISPHTSSFKKKKKKK